MLLVGSDLQFGQSIQTHLHKTFMLSAAMVRFDDVAHLVRRDTDGVLLFLASDAHDIDRIEACVRELRIQQLPVRLAVLAAENYPATRRIDQLATQLDANFGWPGHLREFNTWVRRVVTPGVPFPDPAVETAAERIRHRLHQLTPSLAFLAEQTLTAASHDVAVLIEGETGTGKTHLGKLIHDCSKRALGRFLVVSCNANPGHSIATDFYGQHAGVEGGRTGKIAAAGNGTLFLDEIGLLGLEQQTQMLRLIESGEYEPVGGHETVQCEARIIAASNSSLAEAVQRGTFRSDLFYRLNVISFRLPPLRERPQDIPPLVRGMVARYGSRFGKPVQAIHAEAMRSLEQFPWPGNIRQLENVLQQSVLNCPGDELRLQHLPPLVQNSTSPPGAPGHTAIPAGSLAHNRETTERTAILRALEKSAYSRTRAAQALGVSRVTLYKKMKKYGLLAKSGPYPEAGLAVAGSPPR
jgi:DNA-binding NtrC family response regulator